jgi:cation:H+ antiporter
MVALLIAGLALLIVGAELLVRGASKLAVAAGISPLVVGLTVVAFGTSAPELAVSVQAAAAGQGQLALGNVVGSNIFNVLFILGLSAVVTPLVVSAQLVRLDVPLMIGASALALVLGLDGQISRVDGAILFSCIVAYTWFLIRKSRRETSEALGNSARGKPDTPTATNTARAAADPDEALTSSDSPKFGWPIQLLLIAGGLALLVLGARWLVTSASSIARDFGMSELTIGLTIVAAGTSFPEVATSVMASIRGERDIAVGNVVGSNLFNLLAVLGGAALLAPAGIPVPQAALSFDIPIMLATAVACLPIFFTGHLIARWEGALFLAYYIAYVMWLILAGAQHEALDTYGFVMITVVIPLTALTLAVLGGRAFLQSRKGRGD